MTNKSHTHAERGARQDEHIHAERRESFPLPQSEIAERLRELGDYGVALAMSYEIACEQYPELQQIDFIISNSQEYPDLQNSGGFARHQSRTPSERPLVVFNGGSGIEHFSMLLQARKVSAVICAEKIGIEPSALRPEMLAVFILLHELGHAYDYLVHVPDPEAHRARRRDDMRTLPIPGQNPGMLTRALAPGGAFDTWFTLHGAQLEKAGYPTRQALIEAQERAYHAIPSEDFPDQFAAVIIKQNFERLFGKT